MTHIEKLSGHFRDGLTISPMEAIALYGMTRLARVVADLKRKGWEIKTEMRESRTGQQYARYYPLRGPDGDAIHLREGAH